MELLPGTYVYQYFAISKTASHNMTSCMSVASSATLQDTAIKHFKNISVRVLNSIYSKIALGTYSG